MPIKTVCAMPDTYFDLVKTFPLAHIRDDDHLIAAREVMERLLEKNLDEGEDQYLDALTDLIEVYEDDHVKFPDVSEADVLRELMRANGLTQAALAKKVGVTQSTISSVLNGARSLTKDQVIAIAKFFGVAPGAFLPA
jgi:HTH-type transcriptional regulator / antitoxin HigA